MAESHHVSILDHFDDLDDPRVERTRRHQLVDILAIAICAAICGNALPGLLGPCGTLRQEQAARNGFGKTARTFQLERRSPATASPPAVSDVTTAFPAMSLRREGQPTSPIP